MEAKEVNRKKAGLKVDKITSARQRKKESLQRNMNAVIEAVATYGKKASS